MNILRSFVLASLFCPLLFAQAVTDANAAVDALRHGNYEEAIKGLSGDLAKLAEASEGFEEDELRLHQARAYFLAGKNAETVTRCEEFFKQFPESRWRHKIVFLKAQALASKRKFEEALAIYQSEAARIFSKNRQDEVAGHLVTFAELFATEPAPEDLDAPAADYGKALILFKQALDTDCSRMVREKVSSRIVVLHGLSKNWNEAAKAALVYLDEFDPTWRGPFGSVRRLTMDGNAKVTLPGVDRFKVRFHHAEALHRLEQRGEAVRYLRELDEMTQGKADLESLRADANWLRLMAMTQNGHVNNVDEWIKDARQFLATYPRHIWASQVAYKIGSTYAAAERWEEARRAYQEFLDEENRHAPVADPVTMDLKSVGDFESRKRRHEVRRETASFEIGAIFLKEQKFDEAEKQWTRTAKEFSNGEKWAECQKGLVQVDFERTLESVRKVHRAEGKNQAAVRVEARKSLEEFLSQHPLDARLPQLIFVLGEMSYFEAIATDEGKKFQMTPERKTALEKAIAEWRQLISKYPRSHQAKAAEVKIGGIYEHYLNDLEKAVEIYSGLEDGRARKAVLMAKVLKASSPRVFGTHEKPTITLDTRNVETVKIRQYWIDFDSYFRKSQNLSEIEQLDVDLVEPDKTWEVKIPNYQRYLPIQHEVEIPFEGAKAGVCVIRIEGGDLESTTVSVRSDIDIAVRSTRTETLVFARDWKTGKPAPGVKLILADGAKLVSQGVTGDDGVWHFKSPNLKEISNLRVLAISRRGMAGYSVKVAGRGVPAPLAPVGTLTTSRQVHRPGESVNLKAIVRDVKDGVFVVPGKNDREFLLKIRNSQGRLLKESKVTLNDFGTSQIQFGIPADLQGNQVGLSLEGSIRGEKKIFTGAVLVSQQGLPRVKLTLDFEKGSVAPGELIKGKVIARYRWGAPLVNRKVVLTLPGNLSRDLVTNGKGEASFEHPARDEGILTFRVNIPSSDSGQIPGSVQVTTKEFAVSASLKNNLIIAGRDFEINLIARSLDRQAVARKLRVVLERPIEKHPDPVLVEVPGLNISRECLVVNEKVKEQTVETDGKSGKAEVRFMLAEGGSYKFRVFDGDILVNSGSFTVSDDQDPTKLRLFALEKDLSEGMMAKFELHSRMGNSVPALVTIETDKILEYRVMNVKPGSNEIVLRLTAIHAPNFHLNVLALDDRRLHSVHLSNREKRDLKVEMAVTGLDGEEAKPGQKVKVTISVKDPSGKPVEAETALVIARKDDRPFLPGMLPIAHRWSHMTSPFLSGSSCGFQHQGLQADVNLAVRDEVNRQTFANGIVLNDPGFLPQGQTSITGQVTNLEYLEDPIRTNPSLSLGRNALQGALFDQRRTLEFAPGAKMRIEVSEDFRSQAVRTDADGQAVIEMILPREADEWAILAEVLTKNGRLGGAMKSVKIREDYTMRLVLPDGVFEGDSFAPSLVISRSNADAKEEGKVKFSDEERTITFEKNQSTVEISYPQMKARRDELTFEAQVTIGGEVITRKQKLQPLPWGAPVMDRAGVLARAGKTAFRITLPENAEPISMHLLLQPGLNQVLLALANPSPGSLAQWRDLGLNRHPAGELLAKVTLVAYAKKRAFNKSKLEMIESPVEGLIATLVERQGSDGGWAAHLGRSRSDLNLSAVAYEALTQVKALGYAIDERSLTLAETYLKGSIAKSGSNDRAVIQQALAGGGQGDFSACNRLFRARAELAPSGKAHLAMAFLHLKRPEFAKTLLENLGEVKSGEIVTLGRALQGWASLDASSPKALALEKHIWSRCGFSGFDNHLSKGLAVLGLASLYEEREAIAEDFRAVISVNGKEISQVQSNQQDGFGPLSVDLGILKKGENEIAISMEGPGVLRVGATAIGVLREFPKEDWNGDLKIVSRQFLHPGLTYRGLPLVAKGLSPISKVAVGDRVKVRLVASHTRRMGGEVVISERIPAGFDYLHGSLSGAHSGAHIANGNLVITHLGTTRGNKEFSYELVAKSPGEWGVAPGAFFPLGNPSRASYGPEGKLVILPRGDEINEPYLHHVGERYELASLAFGAGEFAEASTQLAAVRRDHPNYQAGEVARMTLWIETAREKPDARLVADSFEVLNELLPELEIPFEKILKVGNAYRELNEFERGMDVFLATLEAGFAIESFDGAALEDQGRFLDALDYQSAQWMDFPDHGEIANSYFALAQQVYSKAAEAKTLTPRKGEKKAPLASALFLESIGMLERFRATHPAHPLADDGAFTIANALFTIKSYVKMVSHAKASQKAYPKSSFSDAFRYLEALGNFWLRKYDAAFAAAKVVAEGDGKDRNLAAYICAQILHAQGKTVDALKWYEKVRNEYPDARDSIAWFEQKKVELDEVKVIRSGEKVELVLKHRNIGNADLQIYRVDLMKLYLREKNLSNISQVNLAGIAPKYEMKVTLKEGEFSDQESKVALPMKEDGAYLIICRGDYLYTSGLVLVTPLKMEVQEDAGAGSVRVNMTDRATGEYLDAVHVKAIGSGNEKFVSGESDLRGVWKAEGLKGLPTVIARDQEGRYAFHRGETNLALVPKVQAPARQRIIGKESYNLNNSIQQKEIWSNNEKRFDKLRRSQGKGVKVNKAIKK